MKRGTALLGILGLAVVCLTVPVLGAGATWKADLTGVRAPDKPATGKVAGKAFTLQSATFSNGILTLRQGKDFFADRQFMIFLLPKPGEEFEDRLIEVAASGGFGSPHIHMSYRAGPDTMPKTEMFMQGYAMRIYFGRPKNGKLPGRIYLCLPDKGKSFVAGNFSAVVK